MKKTIILSLAIASAISMLAEYSHVIPPSLAYAANQPLKSGKQEALAVRTDKFKAEFAYEMAKITAKVVSAPTTDQEKFKIEFAYAAAQITAKVMPLIPASQRAVFAYEMAQITTKIINEPNLDVQKAKADFAYEAAQLTTRIISDVDKSRSSGSSSPSSNNTGDGPKSNADIDRQPAAVSKSAPFQPTPGNPGYIAHSTYTELIDELTNVNNQSQDNSVKLAGEVRLHYAANSGSPGFEKDSSGFRIYLGANAPIDKDWRLYGLLEARTSLTNYDNSFNLSKLYVAGKSGETQVKAGKFGYLMAEGNIYDSSFQGIGLSFGNPVEYSLSYGQTDETRNTVVATARYSNFDYDLEAGVYRYETINSHDNTILSFGGKYHFSNFSLGAMHLESTKDHSNDNNGYVLSLKYGDLKSWRSNTYDLYGKYYNQPRSTYINHGMNGQGARMQGFKGYEFGVNYTLSENLVFGMQYFNLKDKTTDEKSKTLWGQLSQYF